jgi:hypothetical protein
MRPEEFFLRGSIVEVATDPTHPVMAGMPEKAAVFTDGSPVFETLEGFKNFSCRAAQSIWLKKRNHRTGKPTIQPWLLSGTDIPSCSILIGRMMWPDTCSSMEKFRG